MYKVIEPNEKLKSDCFLGAILRLQFHAFSFRLRLYGSAHALP